MQRTNFRRSFLKSLKKIKTRNPNVQSIFFKGAAVKVVVTVGSEQLKVAFHNVGWLRAQTLQGDIGAVIAHNCHWRLCEKASHNI
jgi:hypothetical protein